MKLCTLLVAVGLAATAMTHASAQSAAAFSTNGAHVLGKQDLEKLLSGARVSIGNPAEATRSWTDNGRGNILATLDTAGAKGRPLNGKGTARVDESGAYCVRIEWPRSVESWCRRIFSLHGAYYAAADDTGPAQVLPLDVIQPNAKRLTALGRMWYLARMATSAGAR